jgi:hypothetical protein
MLLAEREVQDQQKRWWDRFTFQPSISLEQNKPKIIKERESYFYPGYSHENPQVTKVTERQSSDGKWNVLNKKNNDNKKNKRWDIFSIL